MELNYLADMNYKQVERLAARTDLALFPIAPTQAHGPHLPMSVDLISANEMTQRTATKLADRGIETLIAPSLAYALADIANSFAGNITIRFETIANMVEDVCVGLAKWGFDRIMIVCGHAEDRNLEAIAEGTRQAEAKAKLKTAISQWCAVGMPRSRLFAEKHIRNGIGMPANGRPLCSCCGIPSWWTKTSCAIWSPIGRAATSIDS